MSILSPVFLFLFFPLSLLFIPFCPPRMRKTVLCFISLSWLVLANLHAPFALLQLLFPVLAVLLISLIPAESAPRLRLWLGVCFPLALFLFYRILAECHLSNYTYPTGIALITLGAISVAIDRYRNDAPDKDTPFSVLGYLILFPTLAMGPVLRYKQYLYVTEHIRPTFQSFSKGAVLYMIGFIKRLAVATLFRTSLEMFFRYNDYRMPWQILLLAMGFAFFVLYFTVSGTTDMARGLLCIYGIAPPRGQGLFFAAITPHRMLYRLLISLDRFLEDYITRPLVAVLGTKRGKLIAAVLVFLCTVLFYRTHPVVLLFALPLLVCALFTYQKSRWLSFRIALPLRILCRVLSILSLCLFALVMLMPQPFCVFRMLGHAFTHGDRHTIYQMLTALPYRRYLIRIAPLSLILLPLWRYLPFLVRKLPARGLAVARLLGAVVLLGLFGLTLIYLYPQFPQNIYATYPL